jgi:hypothetical protein
MNVEIGAEAALFPEKEYINRFFVTVRQPIKPDGQVRQPHSRVDYIYLSGTKSWATELVSLPLLRVSLVISNE